MVDDDDYDLVMRYNWWTQFDGWNWYASGWVAGRTVPMHRLILNAPRDLKVDHINGNGLDNRRSNLRICTHRQNMFNRKINANNSSGYRGVTRDSQSGRWRAKAHGKNLGRYDTAEEAARVVQEYMTREYGEYFQTRS